MKFYLLLLNKLILHYSY